MYICLCAHSYGGRVRVSQGKAGKLGRSEFGRRKDGAGEVDGDLKPLRYESATARDSPSQPSRLPEPPLSLKSTAGPKMGYISVKESEHKWDSSSQKLMRRAKPGGGLQH